MVESAPLLREYTPNGVSRVRIPLPPHNMPAIASRSDSRFFLWEPVADQYNSGCLYNSIKWGENPAYAFTTVWQQPDIQI